MLLVRAHAVQNGVIVRGAHTVWLAIAVVSLQMQDGYYEHNLGSLY